MRIAFVDHYYHQHTKSTRFFSDDVLRGHDITYFWDESWAGKPVEALVQSVIEGTFDLVVVFQSEHAARLIAIAAHGDPRANIVFIPMWDGCQNLGPDYWRDLAGVRIVSFSRHLHERVTRLGLFSFHVQFFPNPDGFTQVDQADAAGFLWWRVEGIGWPAVRSVFGQWRPERFHLHVAPDPQVDRAALQLPTPAESEAFRITTSSWFEDQASFREVLLGSNIFFAPRMSEGIGMAMLEAMAAGMCVIAHDAPTMNEYIVPNVNGFLVDFTQPRALDLTGFRDIGRRARDFVAAGHVAWQADLDRLREFTCAPPATLKRDRFNAIALREAGARREPALTPSAQPKVTVVTVVRNDPTSLAATIANVSHQDYGNLEYIVMDGASTDATLDVIRQHEPLLTRWVSEPDFGPFDAMNKAAAIATGDYVIFMNAGDWFAGPDAITRAFRQVPSNADFVIGHHIFRVDEKDEQLHRAAEFGITWNRLRHGVVDAAWLEGIPGHQATFTRTALLRAHRYDCRLRIAADHDFMYRMKAAGAVFFHSLETISVYVAGGFSMRSQRRLFDEWAELAASYGGPDAIRFFEGLRDAAQPKPDEAGPSPLIAEFEAQIAGLHAENESLHEQIATIRRSASWIVTYPLRWVMRRSGLLRSVWARVPLPGRDRLLVGAPHSGHDAPPPPPATPIILGAEPAAQPRTREHDMNSASAADALPIHFFTIVLNGEPFIRYHETMLAKLPFRWHWHVVEGVAALRHDTAWSSATGGRVSDDIHREGRSNDGTSEYLDDLARRFPGQVTIYRKPPGEFWDGKKEMVNAPLPNITEECLLWQMDNDELWTVDQVAEMRRLFIDAPERGAAYYWCWYFVGPDKVISTRYNYAQNPGQEWLRTWRFRPGDHWAAHEPPTLVRPRPEGGEPVNIATLAPFMHDETEAHGAVFQHFAYVTEAQLGFKESYYGYAGATARWRTLLQHRGSGFLADYFGWVTDKTMFDDAAAHRVEPMATVDAAGAWHFTEPTGAKDRGPLPASPRILIDGIYWQYLASGIGRVWQSILEEWVRQGLADHFVLLDRAGTAPRIAGVHYRTVAPHDYGRCAADSLYLERLCGDLGADLFVSTYYSTPTATPSFFFGHDMIPEATGLDLSDEGWQEKARAIRHAARHLMVSRHSARDLARFFPAVAEEDVAIAYNGLSPAFSRPTVGELAAARQTLGIKRPYLLTVGDRNGAGGYKNAILAFRAAELAAQRGQVFEMICIGGLDDIEPDYRAAAPSVPMRRVKADDAALRLLYGGAHALLYPSRYEGFGMPVLEAMACGCPVVTCANSSLVEVGGAAAIFVDPDDAEAAAEAILSLSDPAVRDARVDAGIAQAATFTIAAQARDTLAALRATIDDLAAGRRPMPGKGWHEFRSYQAGIQDWLQRRPDLATEALSQVGATAAHAAPAMPSGELLRALAEIEAMKKSPFWRVRGLVLNFLRRSGLRHRG